ncbi:hypothetical protein H310_09169 [Aphanomyces invadans]|uniref:Arf-GAP with coiled-coil, ANK repeat and PH domain-containing protein n=1 Tax=Aphanomyces invadans TaxID=157072 RepID=A0A024TW25_9STRA|nr:hypothetical protein H310_09169 [Aphanomyces invadans]ETV97821.1 hypothetical protein H310_09169 [Aphanomyces invadans]|eukprot:XP_008873382.1 hypothetical protein H310_09169 [Aphanomyces invadans]
MEPTSPPPTTRCACRCVAQLEEEVEALQSHLLRYRRKYGNLDVLEQRQAIKESTDSGGTAASAKLDPIPQLTLDDNSTTLISSTVGKHVVLDYVADSPMFRKNLEGLEESTSGLRGFMKELMARTKEFVAAGKVLGSKEVALAEMYSTKYSRSLFTSCYAELGDLSTLLNDFHDTLTQIQSSRESMLLSIEALLYQPLENFIEAELKLAADLRKDVSKSSDDYDALLGKVLSKPVTLSASAPPVARSASSSISTEGPPSSVDDAVALSRQPSLSSMSPPPLTTAAPTSSVDKALMAARCKFELARFDCVRYFNALDAKKKFVLVDAFNSTLYSYLGHFHACHELVHAIEPALRTRQRALQDARAQFAAEDDMFETQRDLLQSRLSAYPTHVALPVEILSLATAASRPNLKESVGSPRGGSSASADKQGYLLVRGGGSSTGGPSSFSFSSKAYKRVWFQIHAGKLYAMQKNMELTVVCDLMISKVRPCGKAALPYTFEVLDNNQTKHILQATSEADMVAWIDAAQNSTERLLGQQPHDKAVHPGHADAVQVLMDANPLCADCDQSPAEWVSINIGVFLCIECSGIHRSLGVHVSKVRSLALDSWDMSLLDLLTTHLGNTKMNAVWEAELAPGWTRPVALSSRAEKEKWIKAKYAFRGFSTHTLDPAPLVMARFFDAATRGDVRRLAEGLAHGVDVNEKDSATGATPLHRSAAAGHALACEYLMQNGASLREVDKQGQLPSDAAKRGGFDSLKLLLLERMRE